MAYHLGSRGKESQTAQEICPTHAHKVFTVGIGSMTVLINPRLKDYSLL
jgi:hypothetical protein